MALISDQYMDIVVQGSMILFMEVYLYFQGLYSLMFVTLVFLYMASGYRKARMGSTACIIVLGDIGRSPRMQYHAASFAKLNFDVDIVGYGGKFRFSPKKDYVGPAGGLTRPSLVLLYTYSLPNFDRPRLTITYSDTFGSSKSPYGFHAVLLNYVRPTA